MEFSQGDIAEYLPEEPTLYGNRKRGVKTKNLSVATDKYRTDIENANN